MTLRVHYLSLDEESGYGVAARRCMLALAGAGISVRWIPFRQGQSWGLGYEPVALEAVDDPELDALLDGPGECDVSVAHLVPEYYALARAAYPPGTALVGHTVWETDRVPSHWPPLLDLVDRIVVPCHWNAEVFAGAGVRTPVHVVPHVAEPPRPAEHATWSELEPERTVFYTIATWTSRKAVWNTVRAYLTAFTSSEPVVLVIKTTHDDLSVPRAGSTGAAGPGTTAFALARIVAEFPRPAPIRLVTRELSELEIRALHTRGDCFVSLCRSEGWGVPAFDAVAFGNPVVITGFGGHLDYLDATNASLVEYERVPVEDPIGWHSFARDQSWAEPSVAHGAELLRGVFAHREELAARARIASGELLERFSPARVGGAMRQALEAAVASARPSAGGARSRG